MHKCACAMASMNVRPSLLNEVDRQSFLIKLLSATGHADTLGVIVERVDPSLSHKKSATVIAFFFSLEPTYRP